MTETQVRNWVSQAQCKLATKFDTLNNKVLNGIICTCDSKIFNYYLALTKMMTHFTPEDDVLVAGVAASAVTALGGVQSGDKMKITVDGVEVIDITTTTSDLVTYLGEIALAINNSNTVYEGSHDGVNQFTVSSPAATGCNYTSKPIVLNMTILGITVTANATLLGGVCEVLTDIECSAITNEKACEIMDSTDAYLKTC